MLLYYKKFFGAWKFCGFAPTAKLKCSKILISDQTAKLKYPETSGVHPKKGSFNWLIKEKLIHGNAVSTKFC